MAPVSNAVCIGSRRLIAPASLAGSGHGAARLPYRTMVDCRVLRSGPANLQTGSSQPRAEQDSLYAGFAYIVERTLGCALRIGCHRPASRR